MEYQVSFSAVNVPEETYSIMNEALRLGKVGQTDLIERFEVLIARFVGAKYCIATCNGTMADAVAVAAMEEFLKPRVTYRAIVPALTFIAQPNSVLYNNLDVKFADVKEDWTINLEKMEGYFKDSIIFGTDLMGRQCTEPTNIEDACEAFGSTYKGIYAGRMGELGTYSFFPSHTISTGEGGAIVTDNEHLAKLCRSIRAHGSESSDPMDKFHFPHYGFNARMTSLQAVLGIALMGHIEEYLSVRRANFHRMQTKLGGFHERSGESIIPHGYPVEFSSEENRDAAMKNLGWAGIECRKFFSCIPLEEPVYKRSGNYPVAEHISHTHLYVPCHQNMSIDDADFVCNIVLAQKGVIRPIDPQE